VQTQVLEGRRAEYGGQIVSTASRRLEARFGRGFGEKTLRRMIQFVEAQLSILRKSGELTPDLVMRDPYMLNFLGLADTYSEKDLEAAILREIERFLLELDLASLASSDLPSPPFVVWSPERGLPHAGALVAPTNPTP
jgi:hypothetical protein